MQETAAFSPLILLCLWMCRDMRHDEKHARFQQEFWMYVGYEKLEQTL